MVPVAVQGASSSTASKGPPCHVAGIGVDHFSRRDEAAACSRLQASEARRGSIDGDDVGAGGGELRGLAAGGGAKIGDLETGDIAEQFGGKRRGRVLHPPRALVIAG